MKKNLILVVMVFMVLFSSEMVLAEESYFGADIVKFKDHGINIQGVYGLNVTEMVRKMAPIPFPLALEARVGASLADDKNRKVNFYTGVYMRPEYIFHQFRPYALLGVTYAKTTGHYNVVSFPDPDRFFFSDTGPDLSCGIGLKYDFGNGLALNVEYLIRLVEDVDGFSLGIRKYF